MFRQMGRKAPEGGAVGKVGGKVGPADHRPGMGRPVADKPEAGHGNWPFSSIRSPAITVTTSADSAARRWFSRPCSSRKRRARAFSGTIPHGGGAGDQGGQQTCGFGGKVVLGKEVVGQPERSAIDKDRLFGPRVGQGCGKVERGLDRDPAGAPVLAMAGDAVAHLLIPGLGGGDVAAGGRRKRIFPTGHRR